MPQNGQTAARGSLTLMIVSVWSQCFDSLQSSGSIPLSTTEAWQMNTLQMKRWCWWQMFPEFLNSLTLLSVLSVSLISRVEKGIPSSFLPTLMVILSERGTTWVFWFRSFSCIGRFLNSQILFVLLTGTLESFFSNRGWATGTEQSLSSVWKRLILQQDDLNRDAIVQKGKQVYEEDQCWWSDHLSTDRVQSLWCTILVLWSWKPFELNLLIGLGQGIMEINKIHLK